MANPGCRAAMADPPSSLPRGSEAEDSSNPSELASGADAPASVDQSRRPAPSAAGARVAGDGGQAGSEVNQGQASGTPPSTGDSGGRKGTPPLTPRLRRAHAALAPWVLAPLLLTVSTGLGYRLLRDWGGLERDQAHGLMVLHEGEWLRHWLGPSGETLYVLANGLGLLWMLASGAVMVWERLWQRRSRSPGPGKG